MHQRGIGDIAIGEDDNIDPVLANDFFHLVFIEDGNAVGIKIAGQLHRITTPGDVRNLVSGEGYDEEFRIVSENYIEVVEVSSSSSQDKHSFHSA